MGRKKTWTADECEGAAKAYIAATHDSVNGSAQKAKDFAQRIYSEFKKLSPPGTAGTGIWIDRFGKPGDVRLWFYIRDKILKDLQKFNGKLNIVLNMGLSGLTHDQKVNIAVALHLKRPLEEGKTNYDFKDFDSAKEWTYFRAWLLLRDTDKVRAPVAACRPSEEDDDLDSTVGAELGNELSSGNDTNTEGYITDSASPDADRRIETSSTKSHASISVTSRNNKRGTYQGRDAAKKQEAKERHMEKRIAALDSIATIERNKLKVIEDLKNQVRTQNMIAMLNHPTIVANQALSEQMMNKILHGMGISQHPPPATTVFDSNAMDEHGDGNSIDLATTDNT